MTTESCKFFVPAEAAQDTITQKAKLVRTSRVEEVGRIPKYNTHAFCLIFEREPIWLLALRKDFTRCIFIHNYNSVVEFFEHLTEHKIDNRLYENVLQHLGTSRFIFSSPTTDAIYLVSGSIPFLNEISSMIRQKRGVFITDNHLRFRRKLPRCNLELNRISHV